VKKEKEASLISPLPKPKTLVDPTCRT